MVRFNSKINFTNWLLEKCFLNKQISLFKWCSFFYCWFKVFVKTVLLQIGWVFANLFEESCSFLKDFKLINVWINYGFVKSLEDLFGVFFSVFQNMCKFPIETGYFCCINVIFKALNSCSDHFYYFLLVCLFLGIFYFLYPFIVWRFLGIQWGNIIFGFK